MTSTGATAPAPRGNMKCGNEAAKCRPSLASGRSRCFCGAEIDIKGVSDHVVAAHLEMQ